MNDNEKYKRFCYTCNMFLLASTCSNHGKKLGHKIEKKKKPDVTRLQKYHENKWKKDY